MDTLLQDFRYGLRMLAKAPGFTAVAMLTLALGIGASTVGFSVFYNLLFNAFAAKNASRLAVPVVQDAQGSLDPLRCSVADLDLVRRENQTFENIIGYVPVGMVPFNDGSQNFQLYDTRVTSDAFEFYGVPALLGRGIEPRDGKPGAPAVFVMSYKTWQGSFNGDPKVLGKSYIVDEEPRTFVGVMPPRFQAFGPLAQIWIPLTWMQVASASDGQPELTLLGRLKPGVNLQTASSNFDVIAKSLAALHPNDFSPHFTARVESADDFLLGFHAGGAMLFSDTKHLIYDLLGAVAILLLIACSNVANLLLARATSREKEIVVRAALGATRRRLIRQLLVESMLVAVSACVVGCALAWISMKVVAVVLPALGHNGSYWSDIGSEVEIGLDMPVLAFAMATALITAVLCGLAPALHATRADLQPNLSGSGKGGSAAVSRGAFRGALVIGEVALSIILLVGAGLMMRTLFALTRVDLGFNPKNVLLLLFEPTLGHDQGVDRHAADSKQGIATLHQIADRLKVLPGVSDISLQDGIPGYGPGAGPQVTVPGSGYSEEAGVLSCDENFSEVLELRLIDGRWLSRGEVHAARHVVVINQKLARDFFGEKNPVGQQLTVKRFQGISGVAQDTDFQIVGVADNMKSSPELPAMPMVFVPVTVGRGFILLLKTDVAPASLVQAVQQQVWMVNPNEIIVFAKPLTGFLHELTYATPEFAVTMFAPLGSIALLLVIAGVFSVMAYTVSLRTHEIGIRMALGAQQGNILRMVLLRGLRLVATGIVVGVAASLELTRFIASQIWGISATDPETFAGVIILLTLVALAACWIPARRAMRIEPMEALRHE
ncbi:MAG TPA: ABC transporter permease [Candidatus Acidoferrales bacterium]|nr:ABC transporter permease [Candidatus Acidoferrales bacterium]